MTCLGAMKSTRRTTRCSIKWRGCEFSNLKSGNLLGCLVGGCGVLNLKGNFEEDCFALAGGASSVENCVGLPARVVDN